MAALATGLMRSLALQQDVAHIGVQAAVALAKPKDSSPRTNLPCLTANRFSCNAPLCSSRRRNSVAAYAKDKDGRDEYFQSVLNLLRERFSRSEKACSKDKPEGTKEPLPQAASSPGATEENSDDKKKDADEQKKDDEEKRKEEEENTHHLEGLKQDLVNALYGTNWGMNATRETHAEIADIITQLEAANPNPAPTETLELLNGKWIMVYTSKCEFLPFVAARNFPLVNVSEVSQNIDSEALTVENLVSLTGPYMVTSFTTCASFDVRSPKRLQIKFEEGVIRTSQLEDSTEVPEKADFMGHKIDLKSLQGVLQPIQDMANVITKKTSEQPPLRIPYPANRVQSWLLTTYVDEYLRIARAEGGGVFTLVKEGCPIHLLLA